MVEPNMEMVAEERKTYSAIFAELQRTGFAGEPDWWQKRRSRAMEIFENRGFPGRKEEAWRYTNLDPITQMMFASPSSPISVPGVEQLASRRFVNLCAKRLVFVNGIYSPELSGAPQSNGFQVGSIRDIVRQQPELLRSHLGCYAQAESQPFQALNQALMLDGAYLRVPRGRVFEQPIQFLFVTVPGSEPMVSHPRVLIVAEESSQVSVIETHLGMGSGCYLSNAVTEIVADEGAVVDHYKLQYEDPNAFHVGTVQIEQGRATNVRTSMITLSGQLVRNETNSRLNGEGSWCELDGLFLVTQAHHVDNYTQLEHAKPHCDSRELYKGILDDRGKGVFRGRIVVAEGAQKTDSKQTNNNLLLSDAASMNTKPQLEIYADDVKCTHGATIGQISPEALFYLRSRGIDAKAARSVLIYAFASEVIGRIKVDKLKEQLDSFLFDWLPRGKLVKETV